MYYGQMRGDYYRGDYYQGDPGFFSFLGGLAKKAVSFIPGIGPAVSTALELIPKGGARAGRMAKAIEKVGPIVTAVGKSKAGKIALGAGALGAAALIGRSTRGAAAGGRRHRRMNVCNVRALRRSIRRTQGFAKLAMRTIHLVHPKKHARFGGFKRRTRKRTV